MESKNKKQIIAKLLAWLGLVIIAVIICVIAYALIHADGKLALAMIFALAFVSIIYWIGIKLYKDLIKFDGIKNRKSEQKKMNDIASMNTKNI